jgi:RND family efflux transporter MFP subunit
MRWFAGIGGMLVAIAGVVAGCQKAAPRVEPPPPKVTVSAPQTRQIAEYDDYNGWVDSPAIVEVRSRVRGHIVNVHFTDGDIVKKDQLLFELDPRPFQQEIDRANEQVGIFQAQLNVAVVEEKRMAQLQKSNSASQVEIETAGAKARSLEAQVEAQKKDVERKKLELEYSRVTAPIAGRIGRAMLSEGNLVNAGGSDPLLTTIVAIDPVQIYFAVDERSLQRYQKMSPSTNASGTLRERKMPFQFGLETDDGYPNQGVLDFADNRVDSQTGTIQIRGVVGNPQGRFVPGSRVRVRLPFGGDRPCVLVPDSAILSDQDRKYVLVIDDKNVVQRRDISSGKLLDDGMRIVTSGVKGEDRVITLGIQMARINYPVEPVAPATQPTVAASR